MTPPARWYHGTTPEFWQQIEAEGALWGRQGGKADRCTYLAADREEAECYGGVVLEVQYVPGTHTDNYVDECWQMRVYGPIPISDVKRVDSQHAE